MQNSWSTKHSTDLELFLLTKLNLVASQIHQDLCCAMAQMDSVCCKQHGRENPILGVWDKAMGKTQLRIASSFSHIVLSGDS